MTTRARDSQRGKLYAAERSLKAKATFKTVAECQAFIDHVCARTYVQEKWGQHRVEVRPGHGHRSATADVDRGVIQAPLWARSELVLLHELAHILTLRQPGQWLVAPHGQEYAGTYLALVSNVMGRAKAAELAAAFKAHRVRFRPPQVRKPLSEERKAVLREQLARARAACERT